MKLSLFWRTFALITLLLAISLGSWYALYRAFEQPAQTHRLASELAASVRFASAALRQVPDSNQNALLAELSAGKALSLHRRLGNDQIGVWQHTALGAEIEQQLDGAPGLTLAGSVNGNPGLWVGFSVDQSAYWLRASTDRLSALPLGNRTHQIGALSLLIVLAVIAALIISRLVNGPLANLARSIDRLSRGEPPPRLREKGPPEIALLNRRFNDLAGDLQAMDADRAIVLAGVSHDVRTPLTRLRLEVEMSPLSEGAQASMIEEIERIDSIVHQFVEFASPLERTVEPVDINQVLAQFLRLYSRERAGGMLSVFKKLEPGLVWQGNPVLLERILSNVFENAIKYATTPGERGVRIDIFGRRHDKGGVELIFRDHGPGVPESALPKLARPFARLDTERSTIGGSGLGLAIVARLARRTRGGMIIENASGGGLKIRVVLRDLDSAKVTARETFVDTLDPVSAPAELLQEQQSTRSARRSRPSRSSLPSG